MGDLDIVKMGLYQDVHHFLLRNQIHQALCINLRLVTVTARRISTEFDKDVIAQLVDERILGFHLRNVSRQMGKLNGLATDSKWDHQMPIPAGRDSSGS